MVLTQGPTVVLGLASSCGLGASPRQRVCDIGEIPVLVWGPSLVIVSVTSTLNKPLHQPIMHLASSAQPIHMQGHIVEAVPVPTCWFRCLPVTPGGQVTVCFLILFSKAGTSTPESGPCSLSSVPNQELGGRVGCGPLMKCGSL